MLFISFFAYSQKVDKQNDNGPKLIIKATEFNIVPSFREMQHVKPDLTPRVVNNRSWINYPTNFDAFPKGKDPLLEKDSQTRNLRTARSPISNFDGAISGVHSGAVPPDPTGAIGPNHYIHSWNSGFAIFDRAGNLLMPHASLGMIWPGKTNGDPIVLYDRYADRFVITQFDSTDQDGDPFALLLAVCQGPDPVNDGWYTYRYEFSTFQDYPHYGIWHDGYYITTNSIPNGQDVYVVNRNKMLAGDPDAEIVGFNLAGASPNPQSVFAPMPMNSVGPQLPDSSLPGYIMLLQDDSYAGGVDRLEYWEVDLDWDTIENSSISSSSDINTTAFDSFTAAFGTGEVEQPLTGQDLDGVTGVISYTMNYWNFGGTNSATVNFNVDVNGDNGLLGIRWMELRETAGNWSVFQEGTYAPNDGLNRFMGNMCMDANGNIGLAYSVGNNSTFAGLRYTGRFATSPLGDMDVAEEVIVNGGGSQTFSNRFGDYSHITLDPLDFQTFWYTSEYIANTNQWRTRITSFKIAPDEANDVGVINITSPGDISSSSTETITVELFNFGTDSQSNIPVWFQIDNGTMVMETFAGPLAPMTSDTYTFTGTGDFSNTGQVYSITASTDLSGDAVTANDTYTKQVTNVADNDVGVTSINTPQSAAGLTASETIEVTVRNFGGQAQSNFDVSYTLDGNTITEQIVGPINSGENIDYSFTVPGDFSSIGTVYQLSSSTSLTNDFDTSNDGVSTTVYNVGCTPQGLGQIGNQTAACSIDGIKRFVLGTIDVDDGGDGCNSTGSIVGFVDRTNLSTDLDRSTGNNTHLLQAQTNYIATGAAPKETLSVWIDFDDNGVFELSEQLLIAEEFTATTLDLSDFNLVIPTDAALGSHILRARAIDPGGTPGDSNDPCADMQWGETHDYIVNIIDTSLSISEFDLNNSELIVISLGNKEFDIILKSTSFTDQLVLTMHNVLGQKLVRNRVENINGQYRYKLNLNGLSSGVYIIRLGTDNFGKVRRIILD